MAGAELASSLSVIGRAPPGDHVLALRLEQDVDDRIGRPGRRIAREGDARARRSSSIAEHHGLDHDGTALQILVALQAPIGQRAVSLQER